ncbi:MAG: helix-turn-helix transcriptional regulator [Myxococcota bacterium]
MKARRTELCMSQGALAKATNVAKRTVERWEAGEMEPGLESRMDIAYALQLPVSVVHSHLAEDAAPDAKPVTTTNRLLSGEAQLFEITELEQLCLATDLSADTILGVRNSVDLLCRAYPSVPAPMLLERAQRRFRYVMELLKRRITLDQHRELLVYGGWLAALLGCIHYDLGHREAADAARRIACRLANEAQHNELHAWTFEMSAWFSLVEGRYTDLIDAAQSGLDVCSSGSVGVQLFLQQAKGYARLKDQRSALIALERGASELAELPIPEHREHHFVFDRAKWSFYVSAIQTWLGNDGEAEKHATNVITHHARPGSPTWAPMRLAGAHIDLALIYARRGELEGAVAEGMRSFSYERSSLLDSVSRADELLSVLQNRFPNEKLVDQFNESLTAAQQGPA